MKLLLVREKPSSEALTGVLFVNGKFFCWALENNLKKIPAGSYRITFYNSPRFKREVPLLLSVPGRSYIEIHPANHWDELEGCIALGNSRENEVIFDSRKACDSLIALIRASKEDTQIDIIEISGASNENKAGKA